jgi:hypothetical protein
VQEELYEDHLIFPDWALHLESVAVAVCDCVGIDATFSIDHKDRWRIGSQTKSPGRSTMQGNQILLNLKDGFVTVYGGSIDRSGTDSFAQLSEILASKRVPHDHFEYLENGYRSTRTVRASDELWMHRVDRTAMMQSPQVILDLLERDCLAQARDILSLYVRGHKIDTPLSGDIAVGESGAIEALIRSLMDSDVSNAEMTLNDYPDILSSESIRAPRMRRKMMAALLEGAGHDGVGAFLGRHEFEFLPGDDAIVRELSGSNVPGYIRPLGRPETTSMLLSMCARSSVGRLIDAVSNTSSGRRYSEAARP